MIVARQVRVSGRVQGVFFRQWTCEQARELGISGWVRNCPDGSVEAHAEGDEALVEQLVQRMRRGPPAARVERVEVEPTATQAAAGFTVRR